MTSAPADASPGRRLARGRAAPDAPAARRAALWAILWAGVTVLLITPPTEVITWGLDSSNYGSYSWMAAQDRQFGGDTLAMTGPYGYLAYGTTYSGHLFGARLIGDLLLKVAFALLVLRLVSRHAAPVGWIWLGAIILFLPNVDDLFYDVAILAAGGWLLLAPRDRLGFTGVLAAALLGFMGLMKGTHLFTTFATLGAVSLQALLLGRPGRVAAVAGLALATFLAGWIAAGQALRNLPGYFHGSLALASGYNETMGLKPEGGLFAVGVSLLLGLLVLLTLIAWSVRTDRARLVLVLFLAGFTFLKWKHGYVRADGHVFIFFNYAVLVLPLVWLAVRRPGASPDGRIRTFALVVTVLTAGLAMMAASEFRWVRFRAMFADLPSLLRGNAAYLVQPGAVKAARERELAHQRLVADLPQIRGEVGDATIDFFGYEQGMLLLNGFNYHPRPMGGGAFNVYHPHLQQRNDAFMRDPERSPKYVLARLQTIDGRLPAADDPLTLQALLSLYEPVRAQRDYVLFERAEAAAAPMPEVRSRHSVPIGEWLDVPALPAGALLLFSVDVERSLTGALRGAVYRPPLLRLQVASPTLPDEPAFRLPPLLARVPIVLSPLLRDTTDLVSLFGAESPPRIHRLRIEAPEGGFTESVRVTFYTLPAPAVAPDDRANEIVTYLTHPLYAREPAGIATEPTGITELFGEPISLVHAPGHVALPVRPGDQQVLFHFGLMPQAYDPGETDGVEFVVEYRPHYEPPEIIFRRLLEPVTEPEDRGMQEARVFLPPQADSGEIRIRTEPGPAGNGAWDQSYLARVQIKRGAFDPRQLTGFDHPPEPPGFPDANPVTAHGRDVRILHPPGEVWFSIPGSARFATVAVGVLPDAYRGENRSDGIGCTVLIREPDGAERELVHRVVDPRRNLRARGPVTLDTPLPHDLRRGAHLGVRIDPGPEGDARWDWSYVQTVRFREGEAP